MKKWGSSAWMACLCLHSPWGLRSPAAWAPSGCGNCYLALTKLGPSLGCSDTYRSSTPTLRRTGDLKGLRRMQGSTAARSPKREQVAHSWYPGAPLSCLLPSHSLHAHTRHAGTKAMERDRIRRKMMKKRSKRKDLRREGLGRGQKAPEEERAGRASVGERDTEKE